MFVMCRDLCTQVVVRVWPTVSQPVEGGDLGFSATLLWTPLLSATGPLRLMASSTIGPARYMSNVGYFNDAK